MCLLYLASSPSLLDVKTQADEREGQSYRFRPLIGMLRSPGINHVLMDERWMRVCKRVGLELVVGGIHCSCGCCNNIQDAPKRSRNIAKRFANGVFSSFMKTSPPSVSTR